MEKGYVEFGFGENSIFKINAGKKYLWHLEHRLPKLLFPLKFDTDVDLVIFLEPSHEH